MIISGDQDLQKEALSQLIEDLGIGVLPIDKQNEIILRMTEVLLKRIFLETMEKLGENGRSEYEQLTEGAIESEQVEDFFREKIQDYDKMVEGVVLEFKNEMMQTNKQ